MIPCLETPRLLLRPLQADDADAIQECFPIWEVVRYLAHVPWPYPPDGARSYLQEVALPAMARGTAWHWTLRPREAPGELIGLISLTLGETDNRGFWLALPFHGRGLMSEACVPVTDFWFEDLGQTLLRVPKAAANLASRRISEKQGMRLVRTGEKDYVGGRMASELWELTAGTWRARRDPRPPYTG